MPIISFLLLFLALFYCTVLLLYVIGWQCLGLFSLPPNFRPSVGIAVIVPARNEAKNIKRCIEAILAQQYPLELFTLLVIDDHSTDETAAIVETYTGSKNVKLLRLSDYIVGEQLVAYKKKAIETAIAQTQQELIITTDADCFMPPQWLLHIAAFYETHHKPQMIAAPVCYTHSNSFFNTFQALDFVGMIVATGASLQWGLSDMCNGANLAYQRAVFEQVDGFKGIDDIASGDDMLLMNKIRKQYPKEVLFLKSKAATVYTFPQPTIRGFVQQRLRWASKSGRYKDSFTTPILVGVYLFNVSILLCTILVFFMPFRHLLPYLAIQITLKLLADAAFLSVGTHFFEKKRWLIWFIPAQLLHIVYIVFIGTLGNLKTYNWKERRVT